MPRRMNRKLLVTGAACALTAGGGCGFDCRQERDQETRDEVLEKADELLAEWLRDCAGASDPAACRDAAIARHRELEALVLEWYLKRAANDHKPDRETKDILDRIFELLKSDFVKKLIGFSGVVSGTGELVLVSSVPVDVVDIADVASSAGEAVRPGSDASTADIDEIGGTDRGTMSSVQALESVANAHASSPNGLVGVEIVTKLRGSFTASVDTGPQFGGESYTFDYSFNVDEARDINGLNVRRLLSGTAEIVGRDLKLVLDSEVGKSKIIIGDAGRGILRIAGNFVATEPDASPPFNMPFKIDLPIEEQTPGNFVIQSDDNVDFNMMVNAPESWFADYDEDGKITPADAVAFAADMEAKEAWTDLNNDGEFGPADVELFDAGTARAVARRAYLAAQGVD